MKRTHSFPTARSFHVLMTLRVEVRQVRNPNRAPAATAEPMTPATFAESRGLRTDPVIFVIVFTCVNHAQNIISIN